jgi:hypothetical protein
VADVVLPFVTLPEEKGVALAVINYRDDDETFHHRRWAYLTNARVVGYDNQTGILFNHRYKDIQRAEVNKSFWKGWSVEVKLENAAASIFALVMSGEQFKQLQAGKTPEVDVDALTQRWVNLINEYVIVNRAK